MNIIDAVAIVESGGNQYAMRFEPALLANPPTWLVGQGQIEKIRSLNYGMNFTGAMRIACTSFGKWQLLGGNLYGGAVGCLKSVLDYLGDVRAQQNSAERFITSLGFDYLTPVTTPEAMLPFATRYNGPGNPSAYAQALVDAANRS